MTVLKKISSVLIASLLIVCIPLSAFALSAEIGGDKIFVKENSIFFVPVTLKNNPGIMGFKINVRYDPKLLSLPTITKGTLTSSGMINEGIGVGEEGSFDVVWSNTENVIGDGSLFTISFNCAEKVDAESTKITLTFSQEDTFNEKYEDVELKCNDIEIIFGEKPSDYVETTEASSREVNGDDIILAVDTAMKKLDADSVSGLSGTEYAEIFDEVNKNLKTITGSEEQYFSSPDDIKGAYTESVKERFVNQTVSAVDASVIRNAAADALADAGAKDIASLDAGAKKKFVEKVEKALTEAAPDISPISGKLSDDEAVEAIQMLLDETDSIEENGVDLAAKVQAVKSVKTAKTFLIAAGCVLAAAVVVVLIAFIIKKKTNGGNKDE